MSLLIPTINPNDPLRLDFALYNSEDRISVSLEDLESIDCHPKHIERMQDLLSNPDNIVEFYLQALQEKHAYSYDEDFVTTAVETLRKYAPADEYLIEGYCSLILPNIESAVYTFLTEMLAEGMDEDDANEECERIFAIFDKLYFKTWDDSLTDRVPYFKSYNQS